MSEELQAVLKVIELAAGVASDVASFFSNLSGGDPAAQKQIADILPVKSASEAAVEQIESK